MFVIFCSVPITVFSLYLYLLQLSPAPPLCTHWPDLLEYWSEPLLQTSSKHWAAVSTEQLQLLQTSSKHWADNRSTTHSQLYSYLEYCQLLQHSRQKSTFYNTHMYVMMDRFQHYKKHSMSWTCCRQQRWNYILSINDNRIYIFSKSDTTLIEHFNKINKR